MRKITALLLAFVLFTSGCAQTEEESADEVSLSFSWWGNETRDARTRQVLGLYEDAHPGVSFSCQSLEFSEYWKRLAADTAGRVLPDLMQMDYMYLRQYAERGLLLDMTPYVEDGTLPLDGVNLDLLEAGSVDGKLYAVCNGVNAPALIYNQTLLEEAGISLPESMTAAEFETVCREVYQKTGIKTNYRYHQNIDAIEFALRDAGLVLVDQDGFRVDTADELLPFFESMARGIAEGWQIPPEVMADRTVSSVERNPLVYGETAAERSWCVFVWSNMLSAFRQAAPEGVKLGITCWPSEHPERSNYLKPSQFFCISADCRNPTAAVDVIAALTNSVEYNKVLLGERGRPASAAVAQAIEPELDESARMASAFVRERIEPHCSPINPQPPAGVDALNQVLHLIEEDLCFGKITAAQAAERFLQEGTEVLEKARG